MNINKLQDDKQELSKLDSHIFLLNEKVKNITAGILDEDLNQAQELLTKYRLKALQIQDSIFERTNQVEEPTESLNFKFNGHKG